MPNKESETEQVVNTAKKWGFKLLKSKLVIILLIIVFTIILLVSCLKEVLDYDTSDKSSKTNEQLYNKGIHIEYKIC